MRVLKICFHLFIVLGINNCRQVLKAQNLIPNNSFETYSICPPGATKIYYATPWFQPRKIGNGSVNQSSSSDYFNNCTFNPNISVPNNLFGFQFAKTGNAYIGISLYEKYNLNSREYAEVRLTVPLEEAKVYKLEFYASLSCYSRYAIKQLDACFTIDSLFNTTTLVITSVVPQIQNNNFIYDTLNWVKVSGSFTAIGGEQFLTLGNFQTDSLTDTLGVINNPLNYFNGAYYYIDDVSLTLDSTTSIGELNNKNHFAIAPNPGKDLFTISYAIPKKSVFVIYDILGVPLYQKELDERANSISINLSFLKPGCYYYSLLCDSKLIESNKLVILK